MDDAERLLAAPMERAYHYLLTELDATMLPRSRWNSLPSMDR
jgi:hypothetical protein